MPLRMTTCPAERDMRNHQRRSKSADILVQVPPSHQSAGFATTPCRSCHYHLAPIARSAVSDGPHAWHGPRRCLKVKTKGLWRRGGLFREHRSSFRRVAGGSSNRKCVEKHNFSGLLVELFI